MTLTCPQGTEAATWNKEGELLRSGMKTDPSTGQVNIPGLMRNDSGSYQCKRGGRTIKVIQLKVICKQILLINEAYTCSDFKSINI